MRIFCADDEKLSLENIVNIVKEIEGERAEVLGFSTGKQLIEAADEKAPDIVFLDRAIHGRCFQNSFKRICNKAI